MKRFFTILAGCIIPFTLSHAVTGSAENQAELFLRTLDKKHVIKSGTPHLIELLKDDSAHGASFKSAYSSLDRPEKDKYADSKNGHFRAHYDIEGDDAPDLTDADLNGVPDYVDSALVYLEYAWDKMIALGYGKPKSDASRGGSGAVDCYIKELSGEMLYGYSSPDNNSIMGMSSAYIIIDNNYTDTIYRTTDFDGLRITTAHEFFHVVQFSYYGGHDGSWWMEHTAVWFEDHVWDDIDDYLYWTFGLFDDRNKPIDTYNGSFEYGAALFAFHIAEQYGADTIRLIWSAFKDRQSAKIEIMDSVLPNGVGQTLSDFAVWLYFTGYRANSQDFFSEAEVIKNTITPERYFDIVPAVDSLEFFHYTFKYIEIIPEDGFAVGDTLICNYENPDNGTWKRQVILYNSPYDYSVEPLNWQQPEIHITKQFDKAVLVVTNFSEENNNKKYDFIYTIDISSPLYVHENPLPESFVLHQNYPNPFNPATTISFTLPGPEHIILRVMNLQGQTISTLADGMVEAGAHSHVFDGSHLPSGIYLLNLTAGNIRLTRKMTLLK